MAVLRHEREQLRRRAAQEFLELLRQLTREDDGAGREDFI